MITDDRISYRAIEKLSMGIKQIAKTGRPSARNFLCWPRSPELFSIARNFQNIRQMFWISWVLLRIPTTHICAKQCWFHQQLGIMMAGYQNLRLIFTAARKYNFGKMVTLRRRPIKWMSTKAQAYCITLWTTTSRRPWHTHYCLSTLTVFAIDKYIWNISVEFFC